MSSNEAVQPLVLTEDEIALTRRCLAAAVDGPFFPDWEIGTLIGGGRDEGRLRQHGRSFGVVMTWHL